MWMAQQNPSQLLRNKVTGWRYKTEFLCVNWPRVNRALNAGLVSTNTLKNSCGRTRPQAPSPHPYH